MYIVLADVRSLGNYYPYGSAIGAGSWSGSSYNYGYNGMLKEGIGDDIYHTHFRNLSNGDFVGWWSPDPEETIQKLSLIGMGFSPFIKRNKKRL